MARLVGEDATATPNVFFSPGRRYWFGKADLCVFEVAILCKSRRHLKPISYVRII